MLPFIPRKVAKAINSQKNTVTKTGSTTPAESNTSNKGVIVPQPQQPSPVGDSNKEHGQSDSKTWKGKEKEVKSAGRALADEEYATLLRLSLSEHALWSNPDLRRNLEQSDDGFLPLTYIMHASALFPTETPEGAVVKAVRSHVEDIFDIRLLMSSPSRAEWYGKAAPSKQSVGGYEIRLKDWKKPLQRSRNSTRNEWESRTVYIEGIPLQHRSIVGIYHLVSDLLPVDTTRLRVQSISLPKHHLDKPGDTPKCKGFALVTLLLDSDLDFLLQRWPWKRQRPIEKEDSNPLIQEAIKYGLRTLSKSRWDALNSEYLQHRQRILEGIAQQERLNDPPPDAGPLAAAEEDTNDDVEEADEEQLSGPPALDLSAPYPPGCLLHSRHVHPETNKTTLRKLFSKASPDGNDGIDYVDFTKGMDTCYLRLATPKHTTQLVAHFSDNPVVQTTGLDDTGSSPSANKKAITVEVVDGIREELYWLKVPEKIRRQAVEKAVLGGHSPRINSLKRSFPEDANPPEEQKSRRRRKR